jgi:hypothetical protein
LSNFDALEKTLMYKRACEMFNIKFIGIGSVVDETPLAENFYSLTKFVARQTFSDAIAGKEITWLRPFYVFDNLTWPRYLHGDKSEKLLINDDAPRDFIHICDVTEGIESVIRLGITGEIDLGSQLMNRPSQLCKIMKKDYSILHNYESKDLFKISAKSEMLSRVWNPRHTVRFFDS